MGTRSGNPDFIWLFLSPSGRIGRQPYVMSIVFWLMLQAAAASFMLASQSGNSGPILSTLLLIIASLGSFVSLIMLSIKRLHDIGYPAVFVLLLFVPFLSFFALIALLVWPSSPPNDFGDFTNRPK